MLSLLKTFAHTLLGYFVLVCTVVFIHFPTAEDDRKDTSDDLLRTTFYETVYTAPKTPVNGKNHSAYVEFDQAVGVPVKDEIAQFVRDHGLEKGKILEVGAGSGTLQDIVEDYTGLDLSRAASRFYHKPFVAASATKMPFEANTFDGLWSVWTLEHVPNPELAMLEMRRVVKDGGYIFFFPAWNVSPYAAQGYRVRPYAALDFNGKFIKASSVVHDSTIYQTAEHFGIRAVRKLQASVGGPTKLHFNRREANYEIYWEADSDAVVSLDPYEAYLWFTSRGDECVSCARPFTLGNGGGIVIRVHKRTVAS
jgi:SAM-dependent methyltransferase